MHAVLPMARSLMTRSCRFCFKPLKTRIGETSRFGATRILGLLTAIPSLVAWSYYNKKVETLSVEMETLCDEFLRRYYSGGKKARA